MSTAIHQIVNANVYMNGNSLLGKAKELSNTKAWGYTAQSNCLQG